MNQEHSTDAFSKGSVPQVVVKNAIPAIAAMLMVMIYNLADTFFVAQTHNDYMVAAVSLATPVFLIFMSLGTLFGIGGTSVISNCYSNIVRAEGKANVAMTGTILGNLLNVILDPIMISVFHWDVAGAAIATVIGNVVGAVYYLVYFWRGKSSLSIQVKDVSLKDGILTGVLAIGIPAALSSLLMSVSQIITNSQMAVHGDLAVAAYGVASKVLMIVTMVGIGLGQGIQPVLGYCYGAKDQKRFRGVLKFSAVFGLLLCAVVALGCFAFTQPIVKIFLTEASALTDGISFTRIMLSTAWLFGLYYVLLNALQAMGAAKPSFVVSVCRQGVIYIPAVFLMGAVMGQSGLVWAQPVADVLSLVLVAVLLVFQMRRENKL